MAALPRCQRFKADRLAHFTGAVDVLTAVLCFSQELIVFQDVQPSVALQQVPI